MCDNLSITTKRLRELIDNYEKQGDEYTRTKIKEGIQCDLSTITKHYNGGREVNSDFIVRYAKFFNVSADYLLGLSDAPTSDKELQGVCDYTGLSPKAVRIITAFLDKKNQEVTKYCYNLEHEWIGSCLWNQREILNSFIEEGHLTELISVISDYQFGLESDIERMNELIPMMEEVKQELLSGVLSKIDVFEYLGLEMNFPVVQLHYYEMQDIPRDFIQKKYKQLIAKHYFDKIKYQALSEEIDALYSSLKEGDPHGNDQAAQ